MEKLFDLSQEYDFMLNQGLKLSGESKEYFIHGRIGDLKRRLPSDIKIEHILDFGCGIGDTSFLLKMYFKDAEITGTDLSIDALTYAKSRYAKDNIQFIHLNDIPANYFDLVYVNGVFHHIDPSNRKSAINVIYNSLRTNGFFALFENNPWNIGTRLVMRRIAFDKEAIPVSPITAKWLVKQGGFANIISTRYLFYFPRLLSIFRFLEKLFIKIPLGAQYYVLSQKTKNL